MIICCRTVQGILIDAYNDDSFRRDRLERVVKFALDKDENISKELVVVYDHKGILTATWRSLPLRSRFLAIIEKAWEEEQEYTVCHCLDTRPDEVILVEYYS